MRTLWLAVAAIVLVGCTDSTGPAVEDELSLNTRKWEKRGPPSYSYDYRAICFCIGPVIRPVRISVADGEVIGVTFLDTQEPVAPAELSGYPTVDDLLEIIRDAIARNAHSIEVRYDALFGYPTEASIDYQANVADEEFGFLASDLVLAE